jgi:hypothetical protein
MDTDCVFYHLDNPSEESNLTCLGIPSNTSLTIILEEIDKRLCGFLSNFGIIVQDTNTVDMTITSAGNIYTIKSDVRIDPASTAPVTISSAGIKIDCCDGCTGVSSTLNSTFNSLVKGTTYFNTLQPNYYVQNDTIVSVVLNELSTLTGDTLSFLKYQLLPSTGVDINTTVGGNITLVINECGKYLKDKKFTLLSELNSKKNCFNYKICSVQSERVDYSERFSYPYRANFQINDLPIMPTPNTSPVVDHGTLYFNDVKGFSVSASDGGAIRKINLNDNETISISGTTSLGSPGVTINNTWGDTVQYDYNSSIIADKDEIVNGEPVLYFSTFGGVVCRIVKERNNQCDERANWKTYVIAGANSNATTVPAGLGTVSGTASRFRKPYGIKRWFDINNEPSFFLIESWTSKLHLLYYSGSGPKNSSNSWSVRYFGLTATTGFSENINVDTIPGGKRLLVFGLGTITHYDFTVPSPSLTDIATLGNYVATTIVTGAASTVDGAFGVARVDNPSYISKVIDASSSDEYYVFGQENLGFPISYAPQSGVLRYYDATSSTPAINSVILSNTNPLGSSGTAGSANGFSQGFIRTLLGSYLDITMGGFREWFSTSSFLSNSVIKAGGASALSTDTEWDNLSDVSMDTQYELQITC